MDGIERQVRRFDSSRQYWEATREKRVMLQYCRATNQYQHFPRPVSIFTGRASDLQWREVSGRGALLSYSVVRRGSGAFRGAEPYVVANVGLDAGVTFLSNVVKVAEGELHVGMRVVPAWEPLPDGTHLLMFEPEVTLP